MSRNVFRRLCYAFFYASTCLLCINVHAGDIQKELTERITKSQHELSALESNIAKQSRALAQKLKIKEDEISELRQAATSAQRLIDEQHVSVEQLKNRVEKWQTQNAYQTHLLNVFIDTVKLDASRLDQKDGEPLVDSRAVELALHHVAAYLTPQWSTQKLVSMDGKVMEQPILHVGPIELGYDLTAKSGGPILRSSNGEARILDVFNQDQKEYLNQLYTNNIGVLVFDPSLGNAYELMKSDDSIIDHLDKGGIWAFPILVFGLLSLIIAILKAIQLVRLPKIDPTLPEKLAETFTGNAFVDISHVKQVAETLFSKKDSAQARLTDIAIETPASQHRDDLLVAYLMEFKHRLDRNLGVVATSAAIAPLLGLLGTVSGMISTFKLMTIFGSGDASTVSGGISEALVTTELGLIVAIPSLIVSALLTRKIRSYSHSLETYAIKLSKVHFTVEARYDTH